MNGLIRICTDKKGFSIIETLVGIVLLGIIAALSLSIYLNLLSNPKNFLRGEAFTLASQEVEYIKTFKPVTDTNYFNAKGTLQVNRQIEFQDSINHFSVKVSSKQKNIEIIKLDFLQRP